MKKARIARQNQRKGREGRGGEGKSGGRILGARNTVGEMSGFLFYLFALAQEPQHQKFFSLPLFRLKLSPQETSTIAAGSLRRIHPPCRRSLAPEGAGSPGRLEGRSPCSHSFPQLREQTTRQKSLKRLASASPFQQPSQYCSVSNLCE